MENINKHKHPGKLLKELESAKIIPTIVEGKNDKLALEKLGFKNILVLHYNKTSLYSIFDKIEDKGYKECLILTDFDKKGKQYYELLKKELVKRGVKINDRFRNILIEKKISHIEGLATFIENRNPEEHSTY